jgi:hypothetical protein
VTTGFSSRDPSVTDVLNPTLSTKVLTLDKVGLALCSPNFVSLAHINFTSTSGTGGATAGSGANFYREIYTNAPTLVGRASFTYGLLNNGSAQTVTNYTAYNKIDWSKAIRLCGNTRFGDTGYVGDANTVSRITLGGYTSAGTGDMTLAGIGIKKIGGVASNIFLTVHNGTTLTDVNTGVAVSVTNGVNWVINSDGAGNVTLYINNSLVASTSAGPSALSITSGNIYREQVEATGTPTVKVAMGSTGGWLYFNR